MSKSDGCKQNLVSGDSGWQADAVKEEITAKRHQPPFHLYVTAQPPPPFQWHSFGIVCDIISPNPTHWKASPIYPFDCLSCYTDFGSSVICDTFVLKFHFCLAVYDFGNSQGYPTRSGKIDCTKKKTVSHFLSHLPSKISSRFFDRIFYCLKQEVCGPACCSWGNIQFPHTHSHTLSWGGALAYTSSSYCRWLGGGL